MKQQVQKPPKQAGFTLIELLITMGLMSILLLVITDIFVAGLEIRAESRSTSGLVQDGRFLMARLSYDINRASAITTPATLGSTSTALAMTIEGTTYTYAITGNTLQLTSPQGTTPANSTATTVSGLSVQRLGNAGGKETVRLSFTLTSTDQQKNGPQSQTFTTTLGRR